MGNYITESDAELQLERLLRVYHNDSGVVQTAEVEYDIGMAENECNASFAVRYAVPLVSTMGIYFARGLTLSLLRLRAFGRMAQVETPEVVIYEAKAARELLRAIREGEELVPGEEEQETGVVNSMGHVGPDVHMSQEELEAW